MVHVPFLDDLPVCILSNIASFVDQHVFSEFILLSRANRNAYLLPTNIIITTLYNLSVFHWWHINQRNLTSVIPNTRIDVVVFSDVDLLVFSGMHIEKMVLHIHRPLIADEEETDDNEETMIMFTGLGFQNLVSIPITELSIHDAIGLVDLSLIYIGYLPLTSLKLTSAFEISSNGMKHLATLRLTSLTLMEYDRITDDGIAYLAHMPLAILDLTRCSTLTDASLSYLTQCPLTYLNLSHCRYTDDGIVYLSNMPLIELKLKCCYGLTNVSLSYLTQCPLMKLSVSGLSISSDAVVRILKLTEFAGCIVDDKLFEKFDL